MRRKQEEKAKIVSDKTSEERVTPGSDKTAATCPPSLE